LEFVHLLMIFVEFDRLISNISVSFAKGVGELQLFGGGGPLQAVCSSNSAKDADSSHSAVLASRLQRGTDRQLY